MAKFGAGSMARSLFEVPQRVPSYRTDFPATLDEIVVNGGRRGLQIVVRPADLILATSAVTVSLRC
jgi:prolyl-tRNA editing enzyme YbaK/EbsC (Cys-tRNA(Pro) deacylase)